jgi:hypothetical protein
MLWRAKRWFRKEEEDKEQGIGRVQTADGRGVVSRTCGDGARRETGDTWERTRLTGSQCGNKSSSSRRSAERNSAYRSIQFREGTGTQSGRKYALRTSKHGEAERTENRVQGRHGKAEKKGEEEEECTTTCTTYTPIHTHAHIRREDGSALYYIKMGNNEMAMGIVWNLRFDKTGNVCAMRCSDVSEVQQRGMECFSAGVFVRSQSCSVNVSPVTVDVYNWRERRWHSLI